MVSVLFRELNEKQSHSGSIPMFDFQIFTVVHVLVAVLAKRLRCTD